MNYTRILFVFISIALMLGACAQPTQRTEVTAEAQPLVADRGNLWTDAYIVVCFETRGLQADKDLVREAIESSWMLNSRLVFADWGNCTAGQPGIHITIENGMAPMGADPDWWGWPRVEGGLGRTASGMSDMRLTFDFQQQAASFPSCTTSPGREDCIRAIAVHEFGHSLGFAHEQDRDDAPVGCVAELKSDYRGAGIGFPNAWNLGPFDDESVMAYCASVWNNNGRLSPNDVFYVQRVYGQKAVGALVAFDGRCLDFSGGDQNGSLAQTYECLGGTHFEPGGVAAPNQRVYFRPDSSVIGLYNSNRVLDVPRNDSTNGNQLQLFDPLSTPGQVWSMPSVTIRALGNMCVGAVNAGATAGTELGLQECDVTTAAAAFRFNVQSDGSLRHLTSGLCIETTGGSGSRLQLQPCSGAANQVFTLTALGGLQDSTGLCMDVGLINADLDRFFGVDNWNRLQLFPCNQRENQQFSFAGPIVGQDGKCIDVGSFARANGTPVQIWDCNGQVNQIWAFYW